MDKDNSSNLIKFPDGREEQNCAAQPPAAGTGTGADPGMRPAVGAGCETLVLPNGTLRLPVYFPDATYGYVRSMDPADLENCGIEGLVMNAFHLMRKPGATVVKNAGGMHAYYGWKRPIITDSGGFQVYSLIRQNEKFGSISNKGIIFRPEDDPSEKMNITPEKSVRLQLSFGADIAICLDDCTHVADSPETNVASVKRTIEWAKRCRDEYDLFLSQKKPAVRPLLFAVIQGGNDLSLRKMCAEALLEIGFDGYGFGGYPLDADGNFLTDIVSYVRSLVPDKFPMFALGIGHPQNIARCLRAGYKLFDCSLPTRDARQGRLMVVDWGGAGYRFESSKWFSYIYILDKKHIASMGPVYDGCECYTCKNYSLSFLHHLYKMNEPLYFRLATIHNLSNMTRLMDAFRAESAAARK